MLGASTQTLVILLTFEYETRNGIYLLYPLYSLISSVTTTRFKAVGVGSVFPLVHFQHHDAGGCLDVLGQDKWIENT